MSVIQNFNDYLTFIHQTRSGQNGIAPLNEEAARRLGHAVGKHATELVAAIGRVHKLTVEHIFNESGEPIPLPPTTRDFDLVYAVRGYGRFNKTNGLEAFIADRAYVTGRTALDTNMDDAQAVYRLEQDARNVFDREGVEYTPMLLHELERFIFLETIELESSMRVHGAPRVLPVRARAAAS